MRRKVTLIVTTLLVLSMLVLAFRTQTLGQSQPQNPLIKVDPGQVQFGPSNSTGQSFTVSISVENVSQTSVPNGLGGAEVHFTWNNTLIQPIDYTNFCGTTGGVLPPPQGDLLYGITAGFYDDSGNPVDAPYTNATQYAVAASSTNGPWWGSGKVAQITFRVVYQPVSPAPQASCTLGLTSLTDLLDNNANEIPHDTENGSYTIQPYNGQSIVVAGMSNSRTIVEQGYPIQTNVTITNDELAAETFNLTLYANTTLIGNKEGIKLESGDTATISFRNWDGLNLPYGNYILKACVWPVNTSNNNYTIGPIIMTMPGDLDGDFTVGLEDLVLLSAAYGSKPGDAKWNSSADIDSNNVVGLQDLFILARNYGESIPSVQNVVNGTTGYQVGGFGQAIGLTANNAPYQKYLDQMNFSVTVLTISEQTLAVRGWPNATLSVEAFDAAGHPIGTVTVPIAEIHATRDDHNGPGGTTAGIYTYTVTMPIPVWAVVGPATMTAHVLTDLPNNGGVPLGPQSSAVNFSITASK